MFGPSETEEKVKLTDTHLSLCQRVQPEPRPPLCLSANPGSLRRGVGREQRMEEWEEEERVEEEEEEVRCLKTGRWRSAIQESRTTSSE